MVEGNQQAPNAYGFKGNSPPRAGFRCRIAVTGTEQIQV